MIERTGDQVEAMSDHIATFIVSGLRWEGTKQELLAAADPVELPAVLDSSDLLELAGHLEDAFGVVIDDEEILIDNFATVRHLAALVVNKQAAAG
jgi:acyl carrier protein